MFIADEVNLLPEQCQSSCADGDNTMKRMMASIMDGCPSTEIDEDEIAKLIRVYVAGMHKNELCSCYSKSGQVDAKSGHSDVLCDTDDDANNDDGERLSQFDRNLLDVAQAVSDKVLRSGEGPGYRNMTWSEGK